MGFDTTFRQLLGTMPAGPLGQALARADPEAGRSTGDGPLLDRAAVEFLADEHGVDMTFVSLQDQARVTVEDALETFAQAAVLTSVINRAATIASPQSSVGEPTETANAAARALLPDDSIDALWRRLAKAVHQLESLALELKRQLDAEVTVTVGAPFAVSLGITF